jgi:hypothetical protein
VNRVLGVLITAGVALGAIGLAVREDSIRPMLIPDPESVVQNFVAQLSAGRYERAREELTEELKQSRNAEALKALDEELAAQLGEYRVEPGGSEVIKDGQATYRASIKTSRQGTQDVEFELERDQETLLWEISSLSGLEALVP